MLAWMVAATIDPIKIGWAIYLFFGPKSWAIAILGAVFIAVVLSILGGMTPASYSFIEWLPTNLAASIFVAAVGNGLGKRRASRKDASE